jgi:hypothetical protein
LAALAEEIALRVGKPIGRLVYRAGAPVPQPPQERLSDPVWSATRYGRFYYPSSEIRERVDEGTLPAGQLIDGFSFAYSTDHQRCVRPGALDPNDPNCQQVILTFYDQYDPGSGPLGPGGGDADASVAEIFQLVIPGIDPTVPCEFCIGWIITLDLEGGSEFVFTGGNFAFGMWYPDPPTLAPGNFGAGPIAGRATRSAPTPSTFGPGSSAPGALDQYDRYLPPGKWTSLDGDDATPPATYLGVYDLGGFDPNFPDPNGPDHIDYAQFWLELYGPSAPICGGDPRCYTDINGDCRIDNSELQCVLDQWARWPGQHHYCRALLSWSSGPIGSAHLQAVLETWANACE